MLGKRHLYGVKMIFNMTLLEILDLTEEENILQTMEWDDNGVPINKDK